MKRLYSNLFAAAVLATAAVSCGKTETEPVRDGNDEIKVNISVASLSPDTKAIKSDWEKGDIINVWLDDTDVNEYKASDGPDFTLTYDGKEWTAAGLSGKESRLKATGGELRGFWEGSNSCFADTTWHKSVNVSTGQKYASVYFPDYEKNKTTGIKTCLVADFNGISYTYDKDILTADINKWHFGTDFQLVVTGIYLSDGWTLYSNNVKAVKSVDNVLQNNTKPEIQLSCSGTGNDGRIAGIANSDGVAFVGQWSGSGSTTFTLTDGSGTYKFTKELAFNSENGSKIIALKIPGSKFSNK